MVEGGGQHSFFSLYGYPIDPAPFIENIIISPLHCRDLCHKFSVHMCVSVHMYVFYSSQQLFVRVGLLELLKLPRSLHSGLWLLGPAQQRGLA